MSFSAIRYTIKISLRKGKVTEIKKMSLKEALMLNLGYIMPATDELDTKKGTCPLRKIIWLLEHRTGS